MQSARSSAPRTMLACQVVLLTPSKSFYPRPLLSCQQSVRACPGLRRVSPLSATLMDPLASVANKRLTPNLTPLDATLTKNRGVSRKRNLKALSLAHSFVALCINSVSHLFCNQSLPHSFSKLPGCHPTIPILKLVARHSSLATVFKFFHLTHLQMPPPANPYGSHPYKCPGVWGASNFPTFNFQTFQPVLDPNVSPPSSYGSLFTHHGSLPRAMLRFNVGGRHE
jgi:hypothetical protein